MTPIRFYSHRGELGYLSNFYPSCIYLDGVIWPTVEHYFQAMKFGDPARREEVRRARTPALAKRLGRRPGLRDDWRVARIDVMRTALRAKFSQHPDLAEKLIGTAEAPLIEAAPKDYFWGEGADCTGENQLGRLLMELRSSLGG